MLGRERCFIDRNRGMSRVMLRAAALIAMLVAASPSLADDGPVPLGRIGPWQLYMGAHGSCVLRTYQGNSVRLDIGEDAFRRLILRVRHFGWWLQHDTATDALRIGIDTDPGEADFAPAKSELYPPGRAWMLFRGQEARALRARMRAGKMLEVDFGRYDLWVRFPLSHMDEALDQLQACVAQSAQPQEPS